MTPREILLAFVILSVVCMIVGAVRLARAVLHILRRNSLGALEPLLTKIEATSTKLDATMARVERLDALSQRAERAVALILASRTRAQTTTEAIVRSARRVRDEWSRLRGTLT